MQKNQLGLWCVFIWLNNIPGFQAIFLFLGWCYCNFVSKYLLLAEFLVRTVNYGPSFFPSIYGPSAKRAGHKSMEKNEDP